MNTLILFDNGGILSRMNFTKVLEALEEISGLSIEELKKRFKEHKPAHYGMVGNNEEYFRRYRLAIGTDLSDDEIILLETKNALPGPIEENVKLKKRLADAGYTVGLLSNSIDFSNKWVLNNWPEIFETYNGPAIFSDKVGVAKPDPKIYELIPKFDRVIYIEDKSSYLKYPVENMGWTGILMTDYQDFSEPIRSEGHGEEPVKGIHIVRNPEELEHLLHQLGLNF